MGTARYGRVAAATWLAVWTSGCVGWRTEQVGPQEVLKDPEVHAVRITRPDKSKVEVYDPILVNDSIVGHPTQTAIAKIAVPLSSVATIATRHPRLGKTLLVVVGVAAAVGVYALLQELNSTTF